MFSAEHLAVSSELEIGFCSFILTGVPSETGVHTCSLVQSWEYRLKSIFRTWSLDWILDIQSGVRTWESGLFVRSAELEYGVRASSLDLGV